MLSISTLYMHSISTLFMHSISTLYMHNVSSLIYHASDFFVILWQGKDIRKKCFVLFFLNIVGLKLLIDVLFCDFI